VNKELSPLALAAYATAAVPGLEVVSLCEPYDNDGSMARQGIVDSQGNHWVVCTPLTDQAGAGVQAQMTLLRLLHRAREKGFLPFDVPLPVVNKRQSHDLRVLVHPEIRGDSGSWESMAASPMVTASMGRAIAALHELPEDVIEFTGLPIYSVAEIRKRLLSLLDEAAAATPLPPNLYDRWEAALDDVSLLRFQTVPVHGDLGPDSFICSGGVVSAMSAFASAHMGDPAEDLAWIMTCPVEGVRDSFLDSYRSSRTGLEDLHLVSRAQLWSELAILRWLLHGVRNEDDEIIQDAKSMLADLSDAVGEEPLMPSHTLSEQEVEFDNLDEVGQVIPPAEEIDPNAPTVNLSEILYSEEDDWR
jgi:macrolide phosphotransferase